MDEKAPSQTKTPAELLKEAAVARAERAEKEGTNSAPAPAPTAPAPAPTTAEPAGSNVPTIEQRVTMVEGILEEDRYPQKYQLPSAPCTISFKNRETGVVYRRVFPDGVAKAENELEHKNLEAMVKLGTCYYFQGVHLQTRSQKAPQPIGPDTHEVV